MNAHVAHSLLQRGGDGEQSKWPWCGARLPGGGTRRACKSAGDGVRRAIRRWVLRNTEYEWARMTLTQTSADDATRSSDALYHIHRGGVGTVAIDKLLNVGPGNYRLRVSPLDRSRNDMNPEVQPDYNPPLAYREWQHHRFNLWEHLLVLRLLPAFNDFDGIHIAGDWTESVGQNAAVRSAIRASCGVGLSNATVAMLRAMNISNQACDKA